METLLLFAAVFVAGILFAGALWVIGYMSSRKAQEDVLYEHGFIKRKKP